MRHGTAPQTVFDDMSGIEESLRMCSLTDDEIRAILQEQLSKRCGFIPVEDIRIFIAENVKNG